MSEITVGTELPTIEKTHGLATSVVYAGASGDMNPLHFDDGFASQVSPSGGIIAHGMYSMGLASRLVTEFAGGPDNVLEVTVRFTKPWPIGTTTTFGGSVSSIDEGVAVVRLWAINENGDTILKGTGRITI